MCTMHPCSFSKHRSFLGLDTLRSVLLGPDWNLRAQQCSVWTLSLTGTAQLLPMLERLLGCMASPCIADTVSCSLFWKKSHPKSFSVKVRSALANIADECQKHAAKRVQARKSACHQWGMNFSLLAKQDPKEKYSFVKIQSEFDETSQTQTVSCGGLLRTTAVFPVLATWPAEQHWDCYIFCHKIWMQPLLEFEPFFDIFQEVQTLEYRLRFWNSMLAGTDT